MNIWLAPEVQILVDLGYTLAYQNQPPTFDPNNILSAVALPLLLNPDPTQVTKVILVGTAIVIATVYVYNIVKWSQQRQDQHEDCLSYYLPCTDRYYYYDCDFCFKYCESNGGSWDSGTCPGITPERQGI